MEKRQLLKLTFSLVLSHPCLLPQYVLLSSVELMTLTISVAWHEYLRDFGGLVPEESDRKLFLFGGWGRVTDHARKQQRLGD